jgi:hypothetical protein
MESFFESFGVGNKMESFLKVSWWARKWKFFESFGVGQKMESFFESFGVGKNMKMVGKRMEIF